jgi:type IV pilus assembly protein PilN
VKDINLIPKEIKDKKINSRKKINNTIICIVSICVFLSIILIPNLYMKILNRNINVLDTKLKQMKTVSELDNKIQNNIDYLRQKQALIKKLKVKKFDMAEILKDLSLNIPEKVSINEIKYKDNVVEISGEAISNKDISYFMLNLRALKYIEDINLVSSQALNDGLIKYILQIKLKVV